MKHLIAVFRALSLGLIATAVSCGMADNPSSRQIQLDAKLNTPVVSANGGIVYLQLTVTSPALMLRQTRRPMNLAVVLDRSGSMSEEHKIDNAKKALYALIDQLHEDDIFSLVIYDDVIEVLREAGPVGNKRSLKSLVEEIYPRNSTNLGGGVIEGFRQAQQYACREYTNRVVLLSDGLANRGITDANELNRIARRYRSQSISLTAMGVGLDYNENLMAGLAESGGGNYYFIESAHQLASIMAREFDLLKTVCARNATIEIRLGRGVTLKDVIGQEWKAEAGSWKIPLGDLYANEKRDVTVELQIPEGSGVIRLASGGLAFESADPGFVAPSSFSSSLEYSKDMALIEKKRDLEAQAKAEVAVSTRTVDQALKALDEGKTEEAQTQLHEAAQVLSASPAAASGAGGALIQNQAVRLESFQKLLKDSSDARKAKKSIQYENYRTQKSKQ
jgi:Ca-activated chloride channel family protein